MTRKSVWENYGSRGVGLYKRGFTICTTSQSNTNRMLAVCLETRTGTCKTGPHTPEEFGMAPGRDFRVRCISYAGAYLNREHCTSDHITHPVTEVSRHASGSQESGFSLFTSPNFVLLLSVPQRFPMFLSSSDNYSHVLLSLLCLFIIPFLYTS